MEHFSKEEGLKRVIGARSLALNAVNLTVGAGIFALPAVVAAQMGSHALWAYVLCGALLGLVLLCFSEVGTKITVTGGVYAYVEAAFGPLAGFLVNTLFWLGFSIMADAAVANVLVDNLAVLFPFFNNQIVRIGFMLFLFSGIAVINIIGVKESSRFIVTVTIVKLMPLLLLIIFGWSHVTAENLVPTEPFTFKQLGETALVLFFAFGGGAEATLNATGEIKNPTKTIPRAMLAGVLLVFIIYMSLQLVAQGVLGNELALQKEAPLAAVALKVFGNYGSMFLAGAAALSCFAMISGDIMVTSRLPYAAARDGLLPKTLARIHPRFATPYYAIAFYAGVGFLLSISGGFRQLAILSSSAILLVYVGVIAATIKLRSLKSDDAFIIPGGITVPLLALAATGWFLSNLSWNEIIATVIFLAGCAGVYLARKAFKKGSSNQAK